ncbi:PE family protein, partial [Mycobacterium interjectum]|uniref:PE family protein n=1 Tax=Mycobacterium interjectum TaxID=33895 RepID=UPI0021F27C1A
MSYLAVAPEFLSSTAMDLSKIGSAVTAAHTAAAAPTAGVVAAAEDEVSAAVASLFSSHGRQFQALSTQAAAFHAQFVQALSGAGGGYAAAEAANVSPLHTLEQAASGIQSFSPWRSLTGRPLFGDGTNGAPGTGQAGGPGGWLFGNGGNGGSGAAGQDGGAGGSAFLFGRGGAGRGDGVGPPAAPARMAGWAGPA